MTVDGLLVIDKPAGPTSHDVVARLRRVLGERRIGHTGTLDPAASGVLPLVLGRATRLARFLSARDKSYEAVIRLGVATDTYDAQGAPSGTPHDGAWPSADEIDRALDAFRGTFVQQPPAFSAKKIEGKRSHKLARAARDAHDHARLKPRAASVPDLPDLPGPPDLPAPVSVTAHVIDIVSCDRDQVALRIDCSAGFYVRSLAHDLGERLGIGAHLTKLRRTRSGDCGLADALTLDLVERDHTAARAAVIPLARMLPGLSAVVLTDRGARHASNGRDLGPADVLDGTVPLASAPECVKAPPFVLEWISLPPSARRWVKLVDARGQLVGIAEPAAAPGLLHPSVVLV